MRARAAHLEVHVVTPRSIESLSYYKAIVGARQCAMPRRRCLIPRRGTRAKRADATHRAVVVGFVATLAAVALVVLSAARDLAVSALTRSADRPMCVHGGPDCLAGVRRSDAPTVGQCSDDEETFSAVRVLVRGGRTYVVDRRVAVADLDCDATAFAAQGEFYRLAAVKDGV